MRFGEIQPAQAIPGGGGRGQAEKITKGAKSRANFKETGCFRRKAVSHSGLGVRVSGTVISDILSSAAILGPILDLTFQTFVDVRRDGCHVEVSAERGYQGSRLSKAELGVRGPVRQAGDGRRVGKISSGLLTIG